MIVVGIETTCDETSVAVLKFHGKKRDLSGLPYAEELSLVVLTQDFHSIYGGVVPELASRSHLENMPRVFRLALEKAGVEIKDIDLVAVANEPGLPGSLIVGVSFAKGLAQSLSKKIIAVNHVEAHIISPLIEHDIPFPFASLVVSGGHTSLYFVEGIGKYKLVLKTRDDSVGEVFDKVAKFFRFGYPGGPVIDALSRGAEQFFSFPDVESEDFSFSGIKTFSVRVPEHWFGPFPLPEFFASFQKKLIDEILFKSFDALKKFGNGSLNIKNFALTGGVAKNSYLRQFVKNLESENNIEFIFPSQRYCTDNGTMIAFLGGLRHILFGETSQLDFDIRPTGYLKAKGGIDK